MYTLRFALRTLTLVVFTLVFSSLAQAQATRTWVSGVGDDANPCSRTAPCKTFAGAISKTAAGGEINVLDPGGFGAVTITKAITIDGGTGSGWGSILASLTNGVIVNAGANDVVRLRNLSIQGIGNGINGIRYLAGKALHVENSLIMGFTTNGIEVNKTAAGALFVSDTNINGCATGIKTVTTVGTIIADLNHVTLERNAIGLDAQTGSRVTMANSYVAQNTNAGIFANSASNSEINLESVVVSHHINAGTAVGIRAGTATGAIVRCSNVSVLGNEIGLQVTGSGQIIRFTGTNKLGGNSVDGAFTSAIAPL